ncbi:acylpyruvate hydrolase [Actinocorallia herbida]|uniref:Acylpyruvate hydrolase n=1 Tax=Actinocorallia herbida TaxID=58109 RepID=A0A3N1D256_9ACTN|nr:fumarylacetoacetate hydrolase family protein [Actinocorallia herbida]ROO87619.1 acylpyruvate hydrolase [Actinocorallia herbida]
MRFASYLNALGEPAVGQVRGDMVAPLADVSAIDATTLPGLPQAATSGDLLPLDSLTLLPVVSAPAKVFCVGLNYDAHITETKRSDSEYPVLFPKYASSLIGHDRPIVLPPESAFVDYEAELAVVIGKAGRRIAASEAMAHVFGYTPANDITMRDYQYKTHQWMQGKAWDDSTPLGPVLVTADEVDVHDLDMTLLLNGEVMQKTNTSKLIFDIPTLIATISEFTALTPGDVILTGTPGGVGYRRDPQVRLQDGDTVEVSISGLGTLRNHVSA